MYANIDEIVEAINRESRNYCIGNLQGIRKRLRSLGCQAGSDIFRLTDAMRRGNYAYHWGGRDEFQFNVRFIEKSDGNYIEYGLAFSLEYMWNKDIVNELRPRIERFNEFIDRCNGDFSGYYVSVARPDESVEVKPPHDLYIPDDWIEEGNFISFFNMRKVPADLTGVHAILQAFDDMLSLYIHAMS
ncbi:MAG: hypothetical protein F4Y39_02340 [Gemmatimonadetes bacterium]|nr:hypothetical protein [Gemmatimonadota bacterium]MYK52953.1 hypothetical protein [Gemmatimonadota bacterium]